MTHVSSSSFDAFILLQTLRKGRSYTVLELRAEEDGGHEHKMVLLKNGWANEAPYAGLFPAILGLFPSILGLFFTLVCKPQDYGQTTTPRTGASTRSWQQHAVVTTTPASG